MNRQSELERLLSTIQSYNPGEAVTSIDENLQYMELFKSPAFRNFTKRSPLIIAIYNFPEQRYEFVSESVVELYGIRTDEFTTEYGAKAFIEMLKPQSLEIMLSEITPKMMESCIQFKEQILSLRFSACLEVTSKYGKDGWLLLHTNILSADPNGFPLLSCTTGMEVSKIKKDAYVHYSGMVCTEQKTTILYTKNLTGTKAPVNFSQREIQIIQYLCQGETTKEIAKKLFLSFDTIKKQRGAILEKSRTKNTAELISFATMTGII